MTSNSDDYNFEEEKPSRGYVNHGKYGTSQHASNHGIVSNEMCKCGKRKKSVTKTGAIRSACAVCLNKYQRESYASGRKQRCVAKL